MRSPAKAVPPPASSSRTSAAATAPAIAPASESSAILRWNRLVTWMSVAPMPCITSIVERWVSSAPRAASTTAAEVAAGHQRDQRQREPLQHPDRAQQRLEHFAMGDEAGAGRGRLDPPGDRGEVGVVGDIERDQRRHRQLVVDPGRAQPALERPPHLRFGHRLGLDHAGRRARGGQGARQDVAAGRDLHRVTVLDPLRDQPGGIGQRQPGRRDGHHGETS